MNRKPHHKGSHKNNKPFERKSFGRKSESFHDYIEPTTLDISQVSHDVKGDRAILRGIIDRVVQTGGPTIFYVSDGTGTLALKAFEKAGVRAHPHINIGDAISATVTIEEFEGELEGEIVKVSKLSDEEHQQFMKKIAILERQRAEVKPIPFLIKSQILEKLKPAMTKAATEIRLAIIQNRPIIIRHHNDTDGYSSGYSLERAVLPLISGQHKSAKAAWEFYTRAPCNAPLYEIDDSIRDTAHSLQSAAKFSNKLPLVIIVDLGSSPDNLLGIQQGKVHGLDFIVVDHHKFETDVISDEVLVHINPFIVGEDGSQFSAGMLCTELARLINPVENIIQIPAMAGMADRVKNPEAMHDYLRLAAERGYTESLLKDISTVIDFISSKLRFMEAREYIEVLFGEPMEKQKALVAILAPYIREMESKGLEIAESAVKRETLNKTTLQILFIEDTYPRGFYPKTGRVISLLHDNAQEKKKMKNVVTLGVMSDSVSIRASDDANFSVHDLIHFLNKKVPNAFVGGGGHKNAGTISFLPQTRATVLDTVKLFIKDIK